MPGDQRRVRRDVTLVGDRRLVPGLGRKDLIEELRIVSLALDAALDAIIVHRMDGTLVRFNEAAANLAGVSTETFAQLPPWGWTYYADPELRDARTRAICEHGSLSFRNTWLSTDGQPVWMEVHAHCVESEGENLIVSVARDVTEQVLATRMLEHLAFHDPLTGLANRASFDDALATAIASARRHGDRLGVAYIDVDEFKDINDSLGHDAGDQVLITLAERLKGCVRPDDTVARLGGDEFVIVLRRMSAEEEPDVVGTRLADVINEPITTMGHDVSIKASVGMAIFDPAEDDARSLVVKADLAMYAAKQAADLASLVYSEDLAPSGLLTVAP